MDPGKNNDPGGNKPHQPGRPPSGNDANWQQQQQPPQPPQQRPQSLYTSWMGQQQDQQPHPMLSQQRPGEAFAGATSNVPPPLSPNMPSSKNLLAQNNRTNILPAPSNQDIRDQIKAEAEAMQRHQQSQQHRLLPAGNLSTASGANDPSITAISHNNNNHSNAGETSIPAQVPPNKRPKLGKPKGSLFARNPLPITSNINKNNNVQIAAAGTTGPKGKNSSPMGANSAGRGMKTSPSGGMVSSNNLLASRNQLRQTNDHGPGGLVGIEPKPALETVSAPKMGSPSLHGVVDRGMNSGAGRGGLGQRMSNGAAVAADNALRNPIVGRNLLNQANRDALGNNNIHGMPDPQQRSPMQLHQRQPEPGIMNTNNLSEGGPNRLPGAMEMTNRNLMAGAMGSPPLGSNPEMQMSLGGNIGRGPPLSQQQQQPPPGLNMHGSPPQQLPPQAIQSRQPGDEQHRLNAPPQQQPPPPPPPPDGSAASAFRGLRVEDALLYLDEVKREFKNDPRVYNEFLSIMKNFKTQEVDTTGVIRCVSNLFRGYNRLILGFNTFLPEGYKISLEDLKRHEAEHAAAVAAAGGVVPPRIRPSPTNAAPTNPVPETVRPAATPTTSAKKGPRAFAGGNNSNNPNWTGKQGWNRNGAPRSEMEEADTASPTGSNMKRNMPTSMEKGPGGPVGAMEVNQAITLGDQVAPSMSGSPPQQQQQKQSPQMMQEQPQHPGSNAPDSLRAPSPPQHQAIEFDHAISYVTTIKRRFANDPGTYHSFLEILHNYQKEQRGIKEVLEQVTHLFQDHPDLLKEFTFFLPDAVQEQAKERLHRAAAESEMRKARMEQEAWAAAQQSAGNIPNAGQQKLIDMTHRPGGVTDPALLRSPVMDAAGSKRTADGAMIVHPINLAQPESNIYNSAVERQFFDAAKEALTAFSRDGGQAWAEFLKCLDMYAQDILSRTEMLTFVEPLLGKRNHKLLEEFQRILNHAGATQGLMALLEDSWYSVPLSDIDFSRCRRCTPSYRALPRDYPAPPCSDRNDTDRDVLNNIWVSLPVGSEESYTFRHMRRNTHEETLFRCEDERFEIDMVIDSNAATLRRLEPIAAEIAQLARNDVLISDSVVTSNDGSGLGGNRYQYIFDKKCLSIIHKNTITRIYGDSGHEMLEFMVKNPTVAIPLIVERLRQKDQEWRAVRTKMNRQWKELAEHNYYKSLDQRSLTWRTIDKRATSNKTLSADIKDRSIHNGKESKDALKSKLDKAKEEHGSFYESTNMSALVRDLDMAFLPKPDRRLFTPHLSVQYDNVSWAQRDAYRIITFALERGATSPAEKERCHRMWFEFLGPWFNIDLGWMQHPAVAIQESKMRMNLQPVAPQVVSDEEDENMGEAANIENRSSTEGEDTTAKQGPSTGEGEEFADHHPLPAGILVVTLYGEGEITGYRATDKVYSVQLDFGTAYMRPSTILCSIAPAEDSDYTDQLRHEDRTKLARPDDHLAFGTQSLFLFFRLHQVLVQRLNIAKHLAYTVSDNRSLKSMVEKMDGCNTEMAGHLRYDGFLALVYALLDGSVGGIASEGGKYDDRLRSLLGHGSYELATMDKLIQHLLKNLQVMSQDDTMWNLVHLYRRHLEAGDFRLEAFRQEAAILSEGESMYAFQHCWVPEQDCSILHVESLGVIGDSMDEEEEDENAMTVDASEQIMEDH